MSAIPSAVPAAGPLPAGRAWHWYVEGWRLWRRAPLALFIMALACVVAEGLLQRIPWAGVGLSKLLVPMLGMGAMLGLVELMQGGRLRLSSLGQAFRPRYLAAACGMAALTVLLVFGCQQAVACAVYGRPALDAVLLGHPRAHPELMKPGFVVCLILPGLVPSTLMTLAPFAALLRGVPPWRAVLASARAMLEVPRPAALLLASNMLIVALILSLPMGIVLLLLYQPWIMAVACAIWRDLAPRMPAPGGAR